MKALIAAGGRSTRMRPISYTRNKHLIPIANEPMIWNAIGKLAKAGITDIIINVNPGEADIMRAACGDGSRWGATLTYVEQSGGALGIAHAVANAEPYLRGGPFVFFLGDNILLGSLDGLKKKFEEEDLGCLVTLTKVDDPQRFGVAEFSADGQFMRAVEKPVVPPSPFAITGIYFFDENYFEAFKQMKPSSRGEYEITDMISWYIENGKTGYAEITGWWKDTGKHADLLEGNALLLDEKVTTQDVEGAELKEGTVIQGNVHIGEGSVIGPNVLIRGPVSIADHCRIADSYIGPYTSIGSDAVVINSEVEHSIIFPHATVECGKRVVDSIIGERARVTSAQQTLPRGNRLVIGDNATVEL